jgi:hypothetical protein
MKPAHERVARREGTDMSTRTKQQTAGNNQYGLDNPGESILFYRRKINRLPKGFSTLPRGRGRLALPAFGWKRHPQVGPSRRKAPRGNLKGIRHTKVKCLWILAIIVCRIRIAGKQRLKRFWQNSTSQPVFTAEFFMMTHVLKSLITAMIN